VRNFAGVKLPDQTPCMYSYIKYSAQERNDTDKRLYQAVTESVSKPVDQLIDQPITQSINQSNNQSKIGRYRGHIEQGRSAGQYINYPNNCPTPMIR